MISKLLKLLIMLALIAFIGLVIFAYAAPWLNIDFAPPRSEVQIPVTLGASD
ncbi:MAG: hypothetical protein ACSHWZ_07750 [Sulfitobacter sp.]